MAERERRVREREERRLAREGLALQKRRDADARIAAFKEEDRQRVLEAVTAAQGTIVKPVFHEFSPWGVSGVVVIAESHVTIHTWPEHGYAAVDIFSCSRKLRHAVVRETLRRSLGAGSVTAQRLSRGLIPAAQRTGAGKAKAT